MGKKRLVDLSHPFGDKAPLWPYFSDVKIERIHYHAKSGVLTQVITTTMRSGSGNLNRGISGIAA